MRPKLRVTLTLSEDLLTQLDRRARAGKETRSGLVERWLRRAAALEVEREIEAATVEYYEGLTRREREDDAALGRSFTRAAKKLAIDDPPSRGPRRRRGRP